MSPLRLALLTALASAFAAATVLAVRAVAAGTSDPGLALPQAREGGLRVVSAIDVGGAPSSLIVSNGAVWVSLGMDGIARIDPATNEVVAQIRPGGAVIGLASGFGAIWAIDVFNDRLLRIDPRTNRVTRVTTVGGLPSGITAGHGSIWVGNQLDSSVSRIDPGTGRTVAVVGFSDGAIWPGALAVAPDGVWVVTRNGNAVSRINLTSSTVDLRVPVPGARSLAVALGSLWVGIANSASLTRIGSRSTHQVAGAGRRADNYGPELAGGATLLRAVPGQLARVRPIGTPSFPLSESNHLSAIAVADGVWIADQDGERVLRLGPSR